MPCSPAKARKLLQLGKAKVARKCPFTIQLLFGSSGYKQEVVASIIPNSSTIGMAAKSNGECIYSSEILVRQDIPKKMKRRQIYRRSRRNRKTRYRKSRFLNRKSDRRCTPTVNSKIESHIREINRVKKLLPVSKWVIVKASKVEGHFKDGSLDEQWLNLQRQTFERDGFKCRHCKKGGKELHAHHIIARQDGGEDTLDNLVTLDKECHVAYHQGKLELKIGKHKFRGKIDTELAILRKSLDIINSENTFGFQAKAKRKLLGLDYSPSNDACAILEVIPQNTFLVRCVSEGDYQRTRGVRSQQKIPKNKIMGFNRYDKVEYENNIYFIKMRMSTGYFKLMDICNQDVPSVISGRKLKLLGRRKSCLIVSKSHSSHPLKE
jgi:5-methylcytosine-specific restriction endonuclease McrA